MIEFKVPANGMYLSMEDEEEYAKVFGDMYNHLNPCKECSNTQELIKTVTFIVTEKCNLKCSYCYECNKTDKAMSIEIAKKAIDMLFDESKIGHYFDMSSTKGYIIEVFGGEPFLEPEIIDFIFGYYMIKAHEVNPEFFRNSHFSTTSNGTLYTNKSVQKVIEKYREKFSLSVTLDGNEKLHDSCRVFSDGKGSYKLAEYALKETIKNSTSKNTKLTLAPENIEYLYEAVVNLWENVGLQFVHANCVYEDVWTKEKSLVLYEQMIKIADYLLENDYYYKYFISLFDENIGHPMSEEELESNFCGGNGQMLAISPDGNLYPCSRFAPYSLKKQPGFLIGDVNEGIYKGNKHIDMLKSITLKTQSSEECLACKVAAGCGLCTAYNYDTFGTPNKRATNICDCHKERVRANSYYWNKLYKKLGINNHFEIYF